ncbi:hypothetical protein AB0M46_46845 [Dactylosporangium sp. NPDC051485]|uniref:hypothetical protein n=1 Tax=Dactylosporangium sp. NPDC051485 TaxID=3154846 RepID=UPI0034368C5E
MAWNAHIVGLVSGYPEETKGEDLAILAGLPAARRLRPVVGWSADWAGTALAFEALAERKVRGKAVLTISS